MHSLRNILLAGAALSAALMSASATHGVDIGVSDALSVGELQCVKNAGNDFMIVRSWFSFGAFDSQGAATIRNARAAGIPYVDAYLFPCPAKSAAQQVADTINGLNSAGAQFGTLWLDIESNPSPGCGWSGDLGSNCNFIQAMINEGHAMGRTIGVYSSPYEWSIVAGDGCHIGSANPSVPLWYADWDGAESFADYSRVAFGGWSKPAMKQYTDTNGYCGVNFDGNWYP